MRRKHRYSSAFNGISVLDLPADRLLLNRGAYPTYNLKLKPIHRLKPREHVAPDNKQDTSKETQVVISALQKMLRQQTKIDPRKEAEFGIAHPVR